MVSLLKNMASLICLVYYSKLEQYNRRESGEFCLKQ
ncbi:hypothetical protein DTO96_101365 [Ephemeroptericola cinctiostellae]|uniref:Uncharacterized protein n=1 Tax=Ephemeroptericola cinctiostellae TaxID=2268024 RepID=A0A345DB96_9BURK|nr:hypothetical protein DTO96_101365 [Ephemeroptericola cinctiostellae]